MFSPHKHVLPAVYRSAAPGFLSRFFVLSFAFLLLAGTAAYSQDQKVKTKTEKMKAKEKVHKQMNEDSTGRMGGDSTAQQLTDTAQHMAMGEAGALPYSATYSSNFTIGDAANARMILNLWKAYDDNNFDQSANMLADTVTMIMANGQMLHGRDSVIAGIKQFRGSLTSAKSTVTAWVPLNSTDRNEQWVAIWGTEEDAMENGTRTTTDLHEIWRINRDGKIDYMQQYMSMAPRSMSSGR